MTPGQFGLRTVISRFCHALQFVQGKAAPESLGVPQQFDTVLGATLDQRAVQRFPQETDQCPGRQRHQGLAHAEKRNPDMALK